VKNCTQTKGPHGRFLVTATMQLAT